jgi:COP9 signalosome complex subunit 3
VLWPYITQFLLTFDPIQVRYVGQLLLDIVHVVVQGAEQKRDYMPAIQLLHHVITRLDPTSSTFTSTHHAYVRLCLLAHAYMEAVPILDRPIFHIPAATDKQTTARSYKYKCSRTETSATYLTPATGLTLKITSRGYLEYYLMGALCYLGAGQYQSALTFLEIVISAPSQQNVASMLMVEAYKKWVLINLLLKGSVPSLPRSTSQTAVRHIKALAKAYDCVAEAFKSHDRRRLRAEIEQGMEIWNDDNNYGLMVEVFNAHRKFAILNLSNTYAAIPVSEVARLTSAEEHNDAETLAYLQNLININELHATITPSTSTSQSNQLILRFQPPSSAKTETQLAQTLASKQAELQALLKHVQDVEHRLEISKDYIEFLRKLKKQRDEEKKDGGGGGKKTSLVEDLDEDMMDDQY